MRYRRMSHRYAVLIATGQSRPFGEQIVFEQFGVRLAQPKWRPSTDVYVSERGIEVTIELAGVDTGRARHPAVR